MPNENTTVNATETATTTATNSTPNKVAKVRKSKSAISVDSKMVVLQGVAKSTHDDPCSFVRSFVVKNHKRLGRSGCIRELVAKHGIAYYTASTQYQRVHSWGYRAMKPTPKKVAKVVKSKVTKVTPTNPPTVATTNQTTAVAS